MMVRFCGTGLLGVCLFALYRLHGLVLILPRHHPTLAEMLLSFTVVVTGIGGAMATVIGPALFQPYPWPPRGRPGGE